MKSDSTSFYYSVLFFLVWYQFPDPAERRAWMVQVKNPYQKPWIGCTRRPASPPAALPCVPMLGYRKTNAASLVFSISSSSRQCSLHGKEGRNQITDHTRSLRVFPSSSFDAVDNESHWLARSHLPCRPHNGLVLDFFLVLCWICIPWYYDKFMKKLSTSGGRH